MVKAISIFLNGEGVKSPNIRNNRMLDASFLLLFNPKGNRLKFTLPPDLQNLSWKVVIDTTEIHWLDHGKTYQENQLTISVEGQSLMVLRSI